MPPSLLVLLLISMLHCAVARMHARCLVMLGTQRKLIDQITTDRQQETPEGMHSSVVVLCAVCVAQLAAVAQLLVPYIAHTPCTSCTLLPV
jgi:hypothetical protein